MSKYQLSRQDYLLKKRYWSEELFKYSGLFIVIIMIGILFTLLTSIISKGYSAFWRYEISLFVKFNDKSVKNYQKLINQAIYSDYSTKENLVSKAAEYQLHYYLQTNKQQISINQPIKFWLPIDSQLDAYLKDPINNQLLTDNLIKLLTKLVFDKKIKKRFNFEFFTGSDSQSPEIAGIYTSLMGSGLIIIICLMIAIPLAVGTAIYLEEFAPKNKLTSLIELNINNLAAVPSIVFGLFGLMVFIKIFSMPRSSALVAGTTLSIMTLPIIIVTTRNAIKAIPVTIKQAYLALGISEVQIILTSTIPLAIPGIIIGLMLAISRIIGETAPLLLIGMVAFIVGAPTNIKEEVTALPVQIYLWFDSPNLGFIEKANASIIILLVIILLINIIVNLIKKKYEQQF